MGVMKNEPIYYGVQSSLGTPHVYPCARLILLNMLWSNG